MNFIKVTISTLAILFIAALYCSADAQNRASNTELGVILGEPTGLSLKHWKSNNTAFDAALAWSLSGNESVHLHANYLKHNWLDVDSGSLAFYYGIGARALLSDNSRFGVRVPIGLQYLIPDSRLGLFFEVAPLLDLIPDTDFDVNGGIGIRYFL